MYYMLVCHLPSDRDTLYLGIPDEVYEAVADKSQPMPRSWFGADVLAPDNPDAAFDRFERAATEQKPTPHGNALYTYPPAMHFIAKPSQEVSLHRMEEGNG